MPVESLLILRLSLVLYYNTAHELLGMHYRKLHPSSFNQPCVKFACFESIVIYLVSTISQGSQTFQYLVPQMKEAKCANKYSFVYREPEPVKFLGNLFFTFVIIFNTNV
jgi:hypothetical protein